MAYAAIIDANRRSRNRALREARKLNPGPTPKVVWAPGTHGVYYGGAVEMTLMSPHEDGWRQRLTFNSCKDYIHEIVWAFLNKDATKGRNFILGTPKTLELDMQSCVIALRNGYYSKRQEEFAAKREFCQQFLNEIEDAAGLEPSQFFQVEHPVVPSWLIVGDKAWQLSPVLLGLFTLLLRYGFEKADGRPFMEILEEARQMPLDCYGMPGKGYSEVRDAQYIRQSWDFIQKFLTVGTQIFYPRIEDNYPNAIGDAHLHSGYGPVAFQTGLAKPKSPIRLRLPFLFRPTIWGKQAEKA